MSKKIFIALMAFVLVISCKVNLYAAEIIRMDEKDLKFTAVYHTIADMEEAKSLWGFKVPGTKRKFALIFEVKIIYGFDTSKVEVQTLEASKQIRVRLPKSKILDIQYDTQNMRVYDQQNGLFTANITLSEQMKVFNEALAIIRSMAEKELKLTEQAESNARVFINILAKSLGYQAEIIFSDEPLPPLTTKAAPEAITKGELNHVAEPESESESESKSE